MRTFRYYCGKCKTEHSVSTQKVVTKHQADRSKKYHSHQKYETDYPWGYHRG